MSWLELDSSTDLKHPPVAIQTLFKAKVNGEHKYSSDIGVSSREVFLQRHFKNSERLEKMHNLFRKYFMLDSIVFTL